MEHIYLERLNKKQIIELNKIYFNKKKNFILYLNKFISSQNDLTGISPLFSRNIDLSLTYYYYCIFILVKKTFKNKKNCKVITSNYILFKFLKNNIKKSSKFKIVYSGNTLKYIKYLFSNLLKLKRFFFIIYFVIIELICKIKYRKSKSEFNKIRKNSKYILVDTTLMESCFSRNKYQDRFYGSFIKKFKSKIVLTEENLLFKKSIKYLNVLEKEKLLFLFKFNILNLSDYLIAFKKVCFPNLQKLKKFYNFNNINLKILINNDIKNSFCNLNFFYGLLNFRFFLKLKKKDFKFKKIINWNENQSADKGFVLGVNTFFPKTDLIGYSPSFVNYNFFFDRQPITQEIKRKYVPKKMYLSSRKYFKDFNKFSDGKISLFEGPLFRFESIKSKKLKIRKNLQNILVLLPIENTEVRNIFNYLEMISKEYKVSVKFHPNFSDTEINKYRKKYANFIYTSKSFYNLIGDNDIIVTNSSSTAIEAILFGKQVISPVNSLFLLSTPVVNFFGKELYNVVYSPNDMQKIMKSIKNFSNKNKSSINELKRSLFNKKRNLTSFPNSK